MTSECKHDITEKYVTQHGLACTDCLTDAEVAAYPGWDKRIERRAKKAVQLAKNLAKAG